ncbi:MAG: 4Fe-4S dicluster domain-containing protein [Planctomycetota bacterium]
MKFRGGYNIFLEGRPLREVCLLPEPDMFYLALRSARFTFSEICVKDGTRVRSGELLAYDPNNHKVPLLAPRKGDVQLDTVKGHIILSDISPAEAEADVSAEGPMHISGGKGTAVTNAQKLLDLGAWQFFSDAYSGLLPDPRVVPQAVLVSTLSLEPFLARGDVQLHHHLLDFTRGLEHIQSLLEYQPIYLVMPHIRSSLASKVKEQIRGYAWVRIIEIPLKYPYDNFSILARRLGLGRSDGPVWSVRTEGVLAVDRALTYSRPCLDRMVSIGGPMARSAVHVRVTAGYPVKRIVDMYAEGGEVRVLDGGILTGRSLDFQEQGLDTECTGLTFLGEHEKREFLGFMRPGWDRRSYSWCFLSGFRKDFPERLDTAMRGELRACIACGFCEKVCPAGIMPHLIHKYLYRSLIEEAEEARADLCIRCGLCSFVCPSKIELRQQIADAQDLIGREKAELGGVNVRKDSA